MIPDKPGDEELRADGVGFGGGERVVDEEGVAHGFVDHAVEDVR